MNVKLPDKITAFGMSNEILPGNFIEEIKYLPDIIIWNLFPVQEDCLVLK